MTRSDDTRTRLLEAIIPHVAFDGWGAEAFSAACQDIGISTEQGTVCCPRGAIDLACDYHRQGDQAMVASLTERDLGEMRFRDRVALAVRLRLETADKELVRRGSVLFALPQNAGDGAQLIWGTADAIWTALGDTSDDANWYSKRATLSAVYGSTALFWLGDDSEGQADSWAFLDRRIDNVMQFEKLKASARKIPMLGAALDHLQSSIRRPQATPMRDVPGTWQNTPQDQTDKKAGKA